MKTITLEQLANHITQNNLEHKLNETLELYKARNVKRKIHSKRRCKTCNAENSFIIECTISTSEIVEEHTCKC